MELTLQSLQQNIDYVAFAIFVLCIIISFAVREYARRVEQSGKEIRSKYRGSWIRNMIKNDDKDLLVNEMRNDITVSVALVSAIIIAFGLALGNIASVMSTYQDSAVGLLRVSSIFVLLAFSLFMVLSELRLFLYIPIVFGTDEVLIEKYEKMPKQKYLSKLVHEAFDHFSNSVRGIFFCVVAMIWFYNAYFFIVAVLVLTAIMISEDFGKGGRITIW
ncbi:MAG: DUF599 family protein [Candidatus Micrarchaeota archaeon]